MKKLILALVAIVITLVPVSADAAPKDHSHKPIISRAIDWD